MKMKLEKTKNDGVLISTMAGMIAILPKNAVNFALVGMGLIEINYWQLAASALVDLPDTGKPLGLIVGAAADLILGGALGLLILGVLRLFGRDLWWYKGLMAGNVIWLLGSGLLVNAFARIVPVDPVFRLTSLFDHQLFGLVTAYLIQRWSKAE